MGVIYSLMPVQSNPETIKKHDEWGLRFSYWLATNFVFWAAALAVNRSEAYAIALVFTVVSNGVMKKLIKH